MPAAVLIPAIATLAGGGVAAGASIYGAKKTSSTAQAAAQNQAAQAKYAADLEAQGNANALAFAQQQEAERAKEFQQTQQQNLGLFQQDQARQQANLDARTTRLAPYTQFGAGAIGQLGRPIPAGGSIGAMFQG